MTTISRALISLAATAMLTFGASAADRTIIVLDASGSMWGQIEGKPKLEIARDTLKTVLQSVPADAELGLMAYGHRQKGACSDIELVVPPALGTAAAISAATDKMKFLGKTPLSEAVRQAAEALRSTEEKATVVLITDGIETCNADPCALGKELEQSGVDFTAHVVGFGLSDEEGRQVACLAENTGGKYIKAGDRQALEDALKQTVAVAPAPPPAPEPEAKVEFNFLPKAVLSASGNQPPPMDVYFEVFKTDTSGGKADRVFGVYQDSKENLEPGKYIVTANSGAASVEQPLEIEASKAASPTLDLNAGVLVLRALPSPGAEPDGNAQLIIDHPGEGASSANYGVVTLVVPAGETVVTVKLGAAEVVETFQVAAGQTITKDIIVGVGKAVTDAYYTPGGEKVDSEDLSWKIFKAARNMDGSREQVSYGFGPAVQYDLPAGDYVALAEMQAASVEQPFSVKVAQRTDVTVTLDAGVVAISAPGGEEFRVFEAKKNLQGERNQVSYGFGEEMQTTLKAGDYVVVTRFAADKPQSETAFAVKAGERTEVTVP